MSVSAYKCKMNKKENTAIQEQGNIYRIHLYLALTYCIYVLDICTLFSPKKMTEIEKLPVEIKDAIDNIENLSIELIKPHKNNYGLVKLRNKGSIAYHIGFKSNNFFNDFSLSNFNFTWVYK